MKVLIKTVAELQTTRGIIVKPTGNMHHVTQEGSCSPKKQEQICGNIVFCYRQPNGNLVTPKRNRDIVDIWLIPDWIIDKILVE